ncbi:chemotaxis protein CheW [Desulfobacterales bacterium HSG17]|nr:chemotaxis protein CheW [Desulfobacterales bacterium HSG17]
MKTIDKIAGNITRQRQFCTFFIAQKLFGVNITDVKEVRPFSKFTPVFHASKQVKGFVNVRGQIHLVIDLRVLLGFESTEVDKLSRIVLFKSHVGESFGVLVDAISDVVETDETRIENMGNRKLESSDVGMRKFTDLMVGNCKLDDKILIILDSKRLIEKIQEKHLK